MKDRNIQKELDSLDINIAENNYNPSINTEQNQSQ